MTNFQENLISIIVPVYNSEKYIRKCIEALLNQTYKNIEIICINDGSTDSSREILEEYASKDYRIKLINNKNSGPATSRNIGLDNATGEYIMFCDSDDTYEPQMCEKMLNAITINNVDLATCRANVSFEDDALRNCPANILTYKMPLGLNKLDDIKVINLSVLLWHIIYTRSLIEKYNIRFPVDFNTNEDTAFNYQYFAVAESCYGIKDCLYNYLVRKNSLTGISYRRCDDSKLFDRIKIFAIINEFLEKNNLKYKKQYYYLALLLNQYRVAFKLTINEQEKKDLITETLKVANLMPKIEGNFFDIIEKCPFEKIEKIIEYKTCYELVHGKYTFIQKIKMYIDTFLYYLRFYNL